MTNKEWIITLNIGTRDENFQARKTGCTLEITVYGNLLVKDEMKNIIAAYSPNHWIMIELAEGIDD